MATMLEALDNDELPDQDRNTPGGRTPRLAAGSWSRETAPAPATVTPDRSVRGSFTTERFGRERSG